MAGDERGLVGREEDDAPTTSDGVPMRPIGIRRRTSARNASSSNIGRVSGVSMNVGATALTAIPTGAHSTASALTRPLTACLLAQYAARPG